MRNIDKGYTDTPIEGVSSLKLDRGMINFGKDFRLKTNGSTEVVLTNVTSPMDRPETVRLARTEISDIYKNTDISPGVMSPSRRGVSLLAQVNETIQITDDTDADFLQHLPVSAHLVLKVPASEYIDATHVEELIGRLISTLYDTGSTSESRLAALLRGSLAPKDA